MQEPKPYCTMCYKDKTMKDFRNDTTTSDGLASVCKVCEETKNSKIVTGGNGNAILSYNDPVEETV